MKINFVYIEDYKSDESLRYINDIAKNSLYVVSSYYYKDFRLKYNKIEGSGCSLWTDHAFLKNIKSEVRKYGGYITPRDQQFILNQTITEVYGESGRGKAFQRTRREIYELFEILLEKKIDCFDEKKLGLILEKSNHSTKALFELYNAFVKKLKEVQNAESEFLAFDNHEGEIPLYQEVCANEMKKALKEKSCLIMEGFMLLYFEQKQLLKAAYDSGKEIYLVTKKNDFLESSLYQPFLDELGAEGNYIEVSGKAKRVKNSLSIIADNLYREEYVNHELDDSVQFIEPFVSREEEFKYVISDIMSYLGKTCGNDEDKRQKALQGDIAVVLHSKKDKLHFNDLLNHLGAGFNIAVEGKTLLDYSLGQFIYCIYKIIGGEIDVDIYKKLLFTQWRFNQNCNDEQFNSALKDFLAIELYFKDLYNIDSWIEQIEKVKQIKSEIETIDAYLYHPVNVVSYESLQFIKEHLVFIKSIVEVLAVVDGTSSEHVERAKEIFLTNANAEFDLELTEKIAEALDSFCDKSMLKINAKFFAEAIRSMLSEFEMKVEEDSKAFLLMPSLENKRVYIPKFESGSYPQRIENEFPFTEQITEILRDERISIKHRVYPYYKFFVKNFFDTTSEALIFTQSESDSGVPTLPSSYIEDVFSLFDKDIEYIKVNKQVRADVKGALFDLPMPKLEKAVIPLPNLLLHYVCSKMFYFLNNTKTSYSDEIPLSIYAGNIMYVRFFEVFVEQNKDRVFTLDRTLQSETERILKIVADEISRTFGYLTQIELNDLHNKALEQIYYFYTNKLRTGKFKAEKFIFDIVPAKIIEVDGYLIKIDKSLVVKNVQNGIKNQFDICKGLYFLVGSSGGAEYEFRHYAEIIEQLSLNLSSDDRLKLIDFAYFKVAVQLASGRFYEDGIKRIKGILERLERSRFNSVKSQACLYCKAKNSCKGISWGSTIKS